MRQRELSTDQLRIKIVDFKPVSTEVMAIHTWGPRTGDAEAGGLEELRDFSRQEFIASPRDCDLPSLFFPYGIAHSK
jgi:hypothetical protein